MQYNDINDIQRDYLEIWKENTTTNYISLESFNKHLHLESYPVLEQYFSFCRIYINNIVIIECKISMDHFIEFIFFYIYFDFVMVFQVLLSCCGIFTNLAITEEQVYDFLQKCKVTKDIYLKDWVNSLPRDKERRVPIAGFFEEFHTTSKIIKPLRKIKEAIINRMITHPMYLSTLQRMYFYSSLTRKNEVAVSFPPESCCDHTSRVLFTNRPNPYHSDYEPFKSEEKVEKATRIVSTMRYRYGYSARPLRATQSLKKSRCSLKSTNSLLSARSQQQKQKANSLIIISDRMFESKQNKKKAGSVCSINQIGATATPDLFARKMCDNNNALSPNKKDDIRKLTLDSLEGNDGVVNRSNGSCDGSLRVIDQADQLE